ncbi:hypothetical protein OMP40_34725 [Cohnella rhizosphaerae]|uniref:Extracellular solute-binding protein n=1 Tax=Cohnella rhizosphaerae TaxID=1457232 RepID=A0A9X4QWJ5_9BACL|nr:hypothetical protein [Cohnella rhizosphaerae]MDG0813865.1 hypothetical protein [Cohnella rhizosphaerae]
MVRRRGNKSKALQALTLTMAAALAASGCSGNTEKEANSSPSAAVSASPTQKAAGTEPVELTWMVNDVMLPDSFGEKFVEEKFNVKLNIVSIPRADYAQRQQIMMTTGGSPGCHAGHGSERNEEVRGARSSRRGADGDDRAICAAYEGGDRQERFPGMVLYESQRRQLRRADVVRRQDDDAGIVARRSAGKGGHPKNTGNDRRDDDGVRGAEKKSAYTA